MRDIKYRDDGRPEDLLQELGYETQDIAYKKFSIYGAYFFGFFTLCIFLGFVFMYFFSPTKLTGGRMGDSRPKTEMPVGTPLLQTNISARTDIRDLRQKETKKLESSAVLDEGKGIYRIPIDKAIEDVAKSSDADRAKMGLPSSSSSNARQRALADIMSSDGGEVGDVGSPTSDSSHGTSPFDSTGGNGG